jgi:hypothetical protein
MKELRATLGEEWQVPWRNDRAATYFGRALARQQRGDRARACVDARHAESLWSELVHGFGEEPWSGFAARAAELCEEVCGSHSEDHSKQVGPLA